MLNKEEKRMFNAYIVPNIERIKKIYFNRDEIYGTDQMIKPDSNGEEGLWKAFADIYDLANHIEIIVKKMLDGEYSKKESYDQRTKRRENERKKLNAIKDKAIKEGQKFATEKYQYIQSKGRDLKNSKEQKTIHKSYMEGLQKGKDIEHLTDKEILNRAKMIKLNEKLGFNKKIGDD